MSERIETTARPRLFGEIAIHLGYLTQAQLEEGLVLQKRRAEDGRGHKLIGVILYELGFMTSEQIVDVLNHHKGD